MVSVAKHRLPEQGSTASTGPEARVTVSPGMKPSSPKVGPRLPSLDETAQALEALARGVDKQPVKTSATPTKGSTVMGVRMAVMSGGDLPPQKPSGLGPREECRGARLTPPRRDQFASQEDFATRERARIGDAMARRITGPDQAMLTALGNAPRLGELQRQYNDAPKAERRFMALAMGGDAMRFDTDTRMSTTLGGAAVMAAEDPPARYETVAHLMVLNETLNHQSRRFAVKTETGFHLLRPTDDNTGLQVATSRGWRDVDDDWVAAQRFTAGSQVAYANPLPERWNINHRHAAPTTRASDGPPFYNEQGGGDTCALHAINHFVGRQVTTPNTYAEWAEPVMVQDGRKLPKSDPEHYDRGQTPTSASDGVSPPDIRDHLTALAQRGQVPRSFANLHIEEVSRDQAIVHMDGLADTRDRFIVGRPGNTHTYALRKDDEGRWTVLDNRAGPRTFDSPGAWLRTLPQYELFYVLSER